MTVISDTCEDLGGHADIGAIQFRAPLLRDAAAGDRIITSQWVSVPIAADGSFTSPDFEPGPARVRIEGRAYDIEIPDWATPVRLGPLLAAALPVPPSEEASAVRNLGGISGARTMTLDAFQALPSPNAHTLYVIPE
ncbi:hypothetical protein [Nocardia sp. CC201C]|uniref:phage upper tail fiber protein n=1 Tax=Nocardia sp. CC201C TaxID=3044575 RepID=UPI0024A99A60|nr:hypothetical protein [Nocardia sp. CC201C]